jgi:uncharacterized protein involved in outer membrane biogenesis
MLGEIINGLVRMSLYAIFLLLLIFLALQHYPDYYKTQLITLIEQQLHYQIQINGEIKLTIFPWLGVELHEVILYDKADSAPNPIKLAYMQLRLRLLALIKGEIELARINLIGLELTNLSLTTKTTKTTNKSTTTTKYAWQIAGVDIEAANLSFSDANYHYRMQGLNLTTDKLSQTELTQIKLQTNLIISDIKTFNLLYSIPIKLFIPLIKIPQLYIPQINLHSTCLDLVFTATSISEFNTVQTQITSENFNLKQCLAQFGLNDLNITTMQFSCALQATKQAIKFTQIRIAFDATTIHGEISIIDIMDNLQVDLNLLIDKLNLDIASSNNNSPILPLERLKNLPLTGIIRINELNFADIKLQGLRLTLE